MSPSACVGVGFAYDKRDGRSGGTTVVGLVISAAAIVASSVFGSSLRHFSETPSQQGWTWDVKVGNPHTQVDTRAQSTPFFSATPAVAGFVGITGEPGGSARVNDTFSAIVGFDGPLDRMALPVLAGRTPRNPDEVAMGTRTLDAAHARVGDEVTIEGDLGSARYRVVGTVVVSPLIANGQIRLGEGMVATLAGLARVAQSPPVNQYLVALRSDRATADGLAALRSQFPNAVVPFFRAADVENLWQIRNLPYLLAVLLVLLSLGTLAHVLIASTRDHRRDLATLAALGCTPRQLSRVVRWQAAALAIPAIAIALPLGIVAGRLAWQRLTHQLGVKAPTNVAGISLALGSASFAIVVEAVALLPGRRAARRSHASALRSKLRE
jgi:hypothetical protein